MVATQGKSYTVLHMKREDRNSDLCSSAMGMAAIGVALYKYVMRFSPKNTSYFNRDRFVLSNGLFTSVYA